MRTRPTDPLNHGSPMDTCGCCGGTGVLTGLVPVDWTGDATCRACGGAGSIFILAHEQTSRYPLARHGDIRSPRELLRRRIGGYHARKGHDEEGDPNR